MAEYFARVELHKASSKDYEKLHEEMKELGFYRFVIDPNGGQKTSMELSPGSYRGWSEVSLSMMILQIRIAANSTGNLNKSYCAVVSDSGGTFDHF